MKLFITLFALLLLTGCGTNAYNARVTEAYTAQLNAYQSAAAAQAQQCATAAAGCSQGESGDLCRVATLLACNGSNGGQNRLPAAPNYRSGAQDFAAVAGPIVNGLVGLGQIAVTGFSIDRNADVQIATQRSQDATLLGIAQAGNASSVEIAGQFGGALGDSLGIIGNLPPTTQVGGDVIQVGGNLGDTAGNDIIGGDRGDNIGGDQIGGDQRIESPGPFTDSNNTTNPDEPVDDGLPPGVFPLPTVGPGG